jgi:hypothetical protein
MEVAKADEGDYSDGGGLLLRVRGESATWGYRFTSPSGRRREMGLGVADRNNQKAAGASLDNARKRAAKARDLLADGSGPIDDRKAREQALRDAVREKKETAKKEALTLARAARAYHETFIEPSKTAKHGAQWVSSLETHMPVELWHKPIGDVDAVELFDHTVRLQRRVPETARRVLQRLSIVFDDAMFRRLCSGNPASAIKKRLQAVQEKSGSLERAETMLTSQAHTLDAIFNKMSVLSAMNLSKSLDIAERLMRLGLKAQSQPRATLETLAQIKNPPVVYARQANVTTGPQQNNFGLPSRGEIEIQQTQLSESTDELLPNAGAPSIEGRANQTLEAVGEIDRAKIARG